MNKPETTITKTKERPMFPFTAIIGQEEMKLALILNVLDPKIGGVMIMGDRGTGKSTVVRSLVDLLPEIEVFCDSIYNAGPDSENMGSAIGSSESISNGGSSPAIKKMKTPMVDLPLGATEDRLCGTIDIEKALTEGVKSFEPGLLAKANRGILYVDEVNLLDDHLVDVLLDSAASGWNTVEREGVSFGHPARFILIGSGNPEEGELRPQLLDRFGMFVDVNTTKDTESRAQIVQQRMLFDQNPDDYLRNCQDNQEALKEKLTNARSFLEETVIKLNPKLAEGISQACALLDIDGLRGDIVVYRAACAYAAYGCRSVVTEEDIIKVAPLCLRHRLRKDPLTTVKSSDSSERIEELFRSILY